MSMLMYVNENEHCSFKLSIMLVVYPVLLFYILPLYEARLSYEYTNNTYFQKCVGSIIKKYFYKNDLTIVNLDTKIDEIVKIANYVARNSVILKKPTTKHESPRCLRVTGGYIIAAEDHDNFINKFPVFTKESNWHPKERFLIIMSNITNIALWKIFDFLLIHNVDDVLVMDDAQDPHLYSYNPFENYQCGHRYDRIIEYGTCSTSQENLFPYKLVTGLRNCTFNVNSPHWPPYSIDPAKNNGPTGLEEKIIRELGKLEQFKVNFFYSDDAEDFTVIKNDVAVGPLFRLQKREAHMIAGGMILTYSRAMAFDYLWAHLAFTEEISYQVKKAPYVPTWKYTYLEFDAVVWAVFIVAFLVFLLIFVIFVRPKDKGRIVLKMIGFLFLAGNKITGNFFKRYLFIHWVLFAYIINVYYVSNLMSFTTNPISNYQISSEEDLQRNLQPCVSRVMKDYLASVNENESLWKNQREGCGNLFESSKTVSNSDKLYTVVLRTIYQYNKFKYLDEWGHDNLYTFNEPITKAIYAIYLHKGFPMLHRLHLQMLRMRENGLIDKYLHSLYWNQTRKYSFKTKEKSYSVVVPWYILIFGHALSLIVFLIELTGKKLLSRIRRMRLEL